MHVVTAKITAKGELKMTKLIPAENAAAATATPRKPKRNKKAHVVPRRAHVPPAQAKSARKATPAKKAPQGQTKAEVANPKVAPRQQQDRQDPRPAETAGRRHIERTDESHRLVAAFRARLPVRHGTQENGADRHLHQGRGRRAHLLGRGLRPRKSPQRLAIGTRHRCGENLVTKGAMKLEIPDDYVPLLITALEQYYAYTRAVKREDTRYQQ